MNLTYVDQQILVRLLLLVLLLFFWLLVAQEMQLWRLDSGSLGRLDASPALDDRGVVPRARPVLVVLVAEIHLLWVVGDQEINVPLLLTEERVRLLERVF